MDAQERQRRFMEAIEIARQKYGVTIQATLQTEKLGEVLLTRPTLQLSLINGWAEDDVQKET